MTREKCRGFTLIEVLIVVVIMAILAATIIPQFTDSTQDAKTSTAQYNLSTMRSQILLYQAQHTSGLPNATLAELLTSTDASGATGSGGSYPFGPYLGDLPSNPFTESKVITVITNHPAESGDVTAAGGWLYNATTGGIWLDDATLYSK